MVGTPGGPGANTCGMVVNGSDVTDAVFGPVPLIVMVCVPPPDGPGAGDVNDQLAV